MDVPKELTADQLDESFDRLVLSGSMDIMTFYLAVIDLAYNGTKVAYHLYHGAYITRARYLYEQEATIVKENHEQESERPREPASRD